MKKKLIGIGIAAILLTACSAQKDCPAAHTGDFWTEDNLDAAISWTDFERIYQISYSDKAGELNEICYEKAAGNQLYMLVVNGGFVPTPDILTAWDGMPYILAEDLGLLGITAEISDGETGMMVSMECRGDTLVLKRNRPATKNGIELEDGFSALGAIEEKVYVPLCFTAEQFGGAARYIEDFRKEICKDDSEYGLTVSFVVIEMPTEREKLFSAEDGLQKAKELSAEEYRQVAEHLEECGRDFSEDYPNYDPSAIYDTGETLGRYTIYELEGFESLPIFFNQYTGELYGVQPWDPMLTIDKSFPDISKLYQ